MLLSHRCCRCLVLLCARSDAPHMRNNHVQISYNYRLKIGRNCLMNRLNCLIDKIEFSWLNESIDSYVVGSRGASQLGGTF